MSNITDVRFQHLADICGQGDADAMLELSEYFRIEFPKAIKCTNMWLIRSAIYGNVIAQNKIKKAIKHNNNFLEQCFIPYLNFFPRKHNNWYSGSYQGFILNAVGFFAFQPNESYLFSGLNENRFIVVWQEEDYDLPDKDGFGMEEYYNMFCVDEYYQLIPQIPIIYHVSAHDIQIVKSCHKKYMTMINEAKKVIEKRKLFPLWTEFI